MLILIYTQRLIKKFLLRNKQKGESRAPSVYRYRFYHRRSGNDNHVHHWGVIPAQAQKRAALSPPKLRASEGPFFQIISRIPKISLRDFQDNK